MYAPPSPRLPPCTVQEPSFCSCTHSTTQCKDFSFSLEISCSGVNQSVQIPKVANQHFNLILHVISTVQLSHVGPQINNQGLPGFLTLYILEHTSFTIDPHLLPSGLMSVCTKAVTNASDYTGKQNKEEWPYKRLVEVCLHISCVHHTYICTQCRADTTFGTLSTCTKQKTANPSFSLV